MISQSLITQKISELVIEAQTGVKRPNLLRPSDAVVVDEVTISDEASIIQRLSNAMDSKDSERAAYVNSVRNRVESGGYVVSEEVAEKVARKILGLKP
jgi:anti-sigma28 factor (negative regulator of flagellin synthesis)